MADEDALRERGRDDSWVALSDAPLPVGEAYRFLTHPGAGGVALFVGTTRRWTGERETRHLDYEAYEPMALGEMARLCAAARARWALTRACLLHRLGTVPVAEASVIAGASAPHRAEAFEAARWLIDELKASVPIWKREVFADGSTEWARPGT